MSAPWRKEVLHRLVAGRRRAPKRAGPRRLPGARLPLRVQLVATLVVLVLAALLVTGVAAATALRSYLLDRVDAQLRGLATTQVGRILAGGPLDPDAGQGLDARGGHAGAGAGSSLPSAFYLAILRGDGTLIGQVADTIPGSHATPVLPTLTASDVAARGGHAFTVAGSSGSGTWRLLATAAGSSGASVVVGMSLTDLTDTVGQLELIELVAGVVVLVVLAGLGYTVVRRSLRPLVEVERTADAIAAGDLTRRVPERDVRSEVGKLGGALNAMLGQIESAFRSREASEAAARASEERMR
ncbi:MAG TPA: HAMP domain-containing protein, partial [Mycobacteriales bacterium]|nr:HAMP domain-containing protein [Mycobacteriales bacterium]